MLAALPWVVIGPFARATLSAPFAVRAAWTGGTAALVGVVLGTLFPSGIRYVDRARGAPVALALNGATSVLGSVAAFPLVLAEIDRRNAALTARGEAPYQIIGLEDFWQPVRPDEAPRGLPLPRRRRSSVRGPGAR